MSLDPEPETTESSEPTLVVPSTAPPASRRFLTRENVATATGLLVAAVAAASYFYFFTGREEPAVVATLSKVTGTVSVTQVGSDEWEPAELGTSLQAAQKVRTGPRSGAEISFIDGSIARIQPDSVVLVGEPVADVTAWTIRSGEVSFDAQERSVIVTRNARAVAAANSSGAVDIDSGGESGFRIFEGSAEVQPAVGEAISLSANEGVIVDTAGRAGPKAGAARRPGTARPAEPVRAALPRSARSHGAADLEPVGAGRELPRRGGLQRHAGGHAALGHDGRDR